MHIHRERERNELRQSVEARVGDLFVEPQWTVVHDGDGVPKFQVFAGLNLQFPL